MDVASSNKTVCCVTYSTAKNTSKSGPNGKGKGKGKSGSRTEFKFITSLSPEPTETPAASNNVSKNKATTTKPNGAEPGVLEKAVKPQPTPVAVASKPTEAKAGDAITEDNTAKEKEKEEEKEKEKDLDMSDADPGTTKTSRQRDQVSRLLTGSPPAIPPSQHDRGQDRGAQGGQGG